MRIPIQNNLGKKLLLGLEPEGDTVPVEAGATVEIVTPDDVDLSSLEIDVDEGGISICLMCDKEVWSGKDRLR